MFLPSWSFIQKYNLTIEGYGWFQSFWTHSTPSIFNRLGIHEPVYGQYPKSPVEFVQKVQTAKELLQQSNPPSLRELNKVNIVKPRVPVPPLPTLRSQQVEVMKKEAELKKKTKLKKIAEKEGRPLEEVLMEQEKKETWWKDGVEGSKQGRVVVEVGVGMVQLKEEGTPLDVDGKITNELKSKRYRYENV